MSFQHEYPYGDVHEMNLDWLIQTMQDFINSERAAGNTPTVASVRSYFTHKYPYGDIHELNLDWVIQTALRMEEIGDSVEGDIGALQTRMTAAEGNISTLDNTVSGLSDSIAEIGTEIENINDDVEELQTAVTQHTTQIEDLDDKIDTQVVANPAGTATDALSKIEIGGTVYTVEGSGGSEVEANPAGEPTDTLETIGIDGTVYEVGGSKPVSKTATGNPIHIEDAADAPIVSGTVAFEPIQDLHGYDKPWAGGAGKNKLETILAGIKTSNTDGTWSGNAYTINGMTFTVEIDNDLNVVAIKVNGTASQETIFNVGLTPATGTFVMSGCPNGGSVSTYSVYAKSLYVHDYGTGANIAPSGTQVTVAIVIRDGYTANNLRFYPMIRLATETDPTFEPYSNICPIEGYTDCELEVTGKNLCKWIDDKVIVYSTGEINDNTSFKTTDFIPVKVGTKLYITSEQTGREKWWYDSNKNPYREVGSGTGLKTSPIDGYFAMSASNTRAESTMVEYGQSASIFEPYQSTTYTIDLDGTRYGGKVYPVTGKMSVGMDRIASYNGETIGEPWLSDRDEYAAGTTPTTGAEVVYTLASPTIVQLSPEQIRTLEGTNNISTNMTSMSLEYITQDYQPLVKLIERSAGHQYSTQERVVGTWIDGKPLYEKVVDFGALPNATTKNLNHNISDIDTVFITGGYAKNTTSGFVQQLNVPVPSSNQTDMQSQWYFGVTATYIRCFTLTDRTSYDECKVILQYTKTTD